MSSRNPSAPLATPTTTARVTHRTRIIRPRCRLLDSRPNTSSSPRKRHARGNTSLPRKPSSLYPEDARIFFPALYTTAVTSPRRRPRPCRTRALRSHTRRMLTCNAAAASEDEAVTSTSEIWAPRPLGASRPALVLSARAVIPRRRSERRRTNSSPSAQEPGTSSTRDTRLDYFRRSTCLMWWPADTAHRSAFRSLDGSMPTGHALARLYLVLFVSFRQPTVPDPCLSISGTISPLTILANPRTRAPYSLRTLLKKRRQSNRARNGYPLYSPFDSPLLQVSLLSHFSTLQCQAQVCDHVAGFTRQCIQPDSWHCTLLRERRKDGKDLSMCCVMVATMCRALIGFSLVGLFLLETLPGLMLFWV